MYAIYPVICKFSEHDKQSMLSKNERERDEENIKSPLCLINCVWAAIKL